MTIKVSVIIPTYNRPTNLKRAINSVLNQTLKEVEIIVVDDNNPNTMARKETSNLLEKYCKLDDRIIYIKHKENRNGAVARNTGIRKAKGKYIAFLDDDDIFYPEKLEVVYEQLENEINKNYGGAYTGFEIVRKQKKIKEFTNLKSGSFITEVLSCNFQMGSGSNLFIKRKIIIELNGFDESFKRHQDYEFLVRFFETHELLAINKSLLIINQSAEQLNIPNSKKAYEYRKKYLQKFQYIFDSIEPYQKKIIYSENFFALCQSAIKDSDYKLAYQCFNKSNRNKLLSPKKISKVVILLLYSFLPKLLKEKIMLVR